MKYDFNKKTDRKNTDCIKYDHLKEFFGKEDILPLWVADMDFEVPECISTTVMERARHKIYGYTFRGEDCISSVVKWLDKRHEWKVTKEWVTSSPGVVTALAVTVMSMTNENDKIIIQTPVYPPFANVVQDNNRILLKNKLKFEDGKYTIDFDNLEELAKEGAKMIILCNPHNPVGRVWKKNELLKIGEICKKYNILILSDEIHSDLCFKGYKHIPIASLSEDLNSRTVCCMAPSKTFNIAGLATSIIIIPNKRLRDKFNTQLDTLHLSLGNLFGHTAMKAGYEDGEEWLNQMIAYLESNVKFVENFIKEKIPKVKLCKAEATYLLWLNFSELGLNDEDLQNLMLNKAKVGLNRGTSFGDGGEGFLRMNIACPTSTLEEGLNKILKAINTLL